MKNITLTSDQQTRYKKYKVDLKLKMLAVFDVGRMLTEIRDEGLYKIDGYGNFKLFCQDVLKLNGGRAYKMIEAFKVKSESPAGDSIVSSRQALALKDVPKEDHQAVIEQAKITGPASGKNLAAAVVAVAARKPAGSLPSPPKVYCETGALIPQDLIPLWLRRSEVKEMMVAVSEVKCQVESLFKKKDPLVSEVSNLIIAQFGQVYEGLKYALPYAVCSCNGRNREACLVCHGRGLVSEVKYKTIKPEFREMRAKLKASNGK